jgi:benzoyl-CoA reductase/2-hydroxyglutaryl-CoA dehydratase subunit BcrC/BadD/HgdB
MTANREEKIQKTIGRHLAMEVKNVLRHFPLGTAERPAAVGYFIDALKTFYQDGIQAKSDKPVIGTMCVMVPDELIYAVGGVPLRLCCGASACDQAGAEFLPAKSCPVVKATMGLLSTHRTFLQKEIRAIVMPSTCDQKKKSAEMLNSMGYEVLPLEMPSSVHSEHGRRYWQESVKHLARSLEKVSGTRITVSRLRQAIAKVGAASKEFRQLNQLRKRTLPVMHGSDVLLVNNAYFIDRIEDWTKAVKALNDELHTRSLQDTGTSLCMAPRILLTGSPPIFPNLKVPLLVEQSGALIVADEVCSSTRLLYDTVTYDEQALYDMIPAVADRYLKASTCPCFTPNANRPRRLMEMAAEAKIDGVVYQAYSGCMPYEMEHKAIADALTEKGVPMLYVETDYSPEDMGQLSTRVEAFLESIRSKKKKSRVNGTRQLIRKEAV